MALNKVDNKSNMYGWVDATINFIKGRCKHNCSYCYAKYINCYPPKLDEKEFQTKLISYEKIEVKPDDDLFGDAEPIIKKVVKPLSIFVGSSIDMYADNIPFDWVLKVYDYSKLYPQNTYILQSKNPAKMLCAIHALPEKHMLGITLETNRHLKHIMNECPTPQDRVDACKSKNAIHFITAEPLIDFDYNEFLQMIIDVTPKFINIGGNTNTSVQLPEPDKHKINKLIHTLQELEYDVRLKSNLDRLL